MPRSWASPSSSLGRTTSSNPGFQHSYTSCPEPEFPSFLGFSGSRWASCAGLQTVLRCQWCHFLGAEWKQPGRWWMDQGPCYLMLRFPPHGTPALPTLTPATGLWMHPWPLVLLCPPPRMPSPCVFVWPSPTPRPIMVSDKPLKPLTLLHLHQEGQVDTCALLGSPVTIVCLSRSSPSPIPTPQGVSTSHSSRSVFSVGGNVNWCSHCGKQYGGSSKN